MKKKSGKIGGTAFQKLTRDHCSILKQAFESFLVWECFGDLIRDVHRGSKEYPRVFFFQPLMLAVVSAAFDSFIVNLHKFHEKRSQKLEILIEVGEKHGGIEPSLATTLKTQIKNAMLLADTIDLKSLRNNVGHYNMGTNERSVLTTSDPTNTEYRDYFERLAAILKTCVSRARFNHSPARYNQIEKRIRETSEMFIRFVRGEKAP